MKKAATVAGDHDVGLVPVRDIGVEMKATAEHAVSYVGHENITEDWAGRPSVPAAVARDAVARSREDEDRRYREDKEAVRRREERERWIKERYNELIAERVNANSRDWDAQGNGVFTPTSAIVGRKYEDAKLECLAKAEKEADKRGL